MPTVRFMGGPLMNKRIAMTDEVYSRGEYIASVEPLRAHVRFADFNDTTSPITDLTFVTGRYTPSKNPEIWSWHGPKIQADPYKTYLRKLEKWKAQMRKLQKQGIWSDTVIPPRPEWRG